MPSGNLAVSPPAGFNQVDVTRAHELHEKLCGLVGAGRQLSYLIAKALYEIKRCEYYTLLDYNSFQEYAESPEIAIGKSQAYKLVSIYECYVIELGKKPTDLDAVPDLDRIGMVVPLIRALKESNAPRAAERIEELIEDATVLSRRDLIEKKRDWLGMSRPGEVREDDILAEFVGAVLVAQERRIEVDGAVKVVLTFKQGDARRRVVFYATGKDVGINVEKSKHGMDRKDAGREARL